MKMNMEMGLDVEEGALADEPLWGINEDIKKYYDSLVREIIFAAAERLGAPPAFLDSQRRFYQGLQRAFKYGQSLGPRFRALASRPPAPPAGPARPARARGAGVRRASTSRSGRIRTLGPEGPSAVPM